MFTFACWFLLQCRWQRQQLREVLASWEEWKLMSDQQCSQKDFLVCLFFMPTNIGKLTLTKLSTRLLLRRNAVWGSFFLTSPLSNDPNRHFTSWTNWLLFQYVDAIRNIYSTVFVFSSPQRSWGDYWSTLGVHVHVHFRARVHSLVKVYVRPFVFSETICPGVMKSCIQMHQG